MASKKELKDQRIPIMMTESELLALDDWSFKNRIRSRGEAIRRLCQMGLSLDENLRELFEQSKKGAHLYQDRSDSLTSLFSDTKRSAQEIAVVAADVVPELLLQLKDLSLVSSQVALNALPYAVAPEFKDAQELSELLKLVSNEVKKKTG